METRMKLEGNQELATGKSGGNQKEIQKETSRKPRNTNEEETRREQVKSQEEIQDVLRGALCGSVGKCKEQLQV